MKPELYVSGTTATLKDGFILPRFDPAVLEKGFVTTAQYGPALAHSWTLRNYEQNVVFSLGQMQFSNHNAITYAIAKDRPSFEASLYKDGLGRLGGFTIKLILQNSTCSQIASVK